jgi:hypothetical protein
MRGDNLETQLGFGDMDLFNQHSFWQLKQGLPFHHDLPLQYNPPLEDPFGRNYIMTCQSSLLQAGSVPQV